MLLALALALPATATPPDIHHVRATPLCVSGDRLMALVHVNSNLGSHYFDAHTWSAVLFDLGAGEVTVRPQGGLTANYVDVMSDDDRPTTAYPEPGAAPLGALFAEWQMATCTAPGGAWQGRHGGDFDYEVRVDGLSITYGGRSRAIEGAVPWYPGAPDADYGPPNREPATAPLASIGDHVYVDAESPWGAEFQAWLPLASREVALIQVRDESEQVTDVLIELPPGALAAQQSWLVNAAGYDAHRARDYEGSTALFQRALEIDRGNQTARYNLACAWARRGEAGAAVDSLRQLTETEGLAAKIAGDPDFDAVRERSVLTEFVAGLP